MSTAFEQEERELTASSSKLNAIRAFLDAQHRVERRGRLARVFGLGPLTPTSRRLYGAALGELEVTRTLERLGSGWTVFHTLDSGAEGSRVDHVVVGPAGVFTVLTKAHVGARVAVAGRVLTADGVRQPWLRIAEEVATHASRLIEEGTGEVVEVTPVLIVVGAASIAVGEPEPSVRVLTADRLGAFLRARPETIGLPLARRIERVASLRARLMQGEFANDRSRLRAEFEAVQHHVDAAAGRARLWTAAALLGTLLVVTTAVLRVVAL